MNTMKGHSTTKRVTTHMLRTTGIGYFTQCLPWTFRSIRYKINAFDVNTERIPVYVPSLLITVYVTKNAFCFSLTLFP